MTDRSNAVGARVSQAFGLAGLASWLLRRTVTKRFPKLTLEQRLAMVPTMLGGIEAPITIRWNAQHIPIVEAQCAGDAAAGLGVVHGHLRLAQIELMRRAAYGRLSEIAGPAAVDLDALLRLVDFPRTTAPSLAMMPAETRAWIEGFCAGLSATAAARPLPPEFEIFQIAPEPFTPQDIFAVSRLCSADYAWRVWRALSALRQSDRWERLWSDVVGLAGGDRRPIGDDTGDQTGDDTHPSLMPDWSQKGSNAMAVAGARTQSGKPLFACDPHLVLTSPSPWMIAGVSAPQLDTVGLMIPALPIFGVGRNHDGAWGGTNLHATSSELIDVADEPITTGVTTIDVRGGRNVERPLRESAWGPLISDAKPFHMPSDTVALHWLGHRPSDDFTPYLNLMKAAHWSDFQEAIDGFSLPGLNMVWADRHGDIGKMVACRVPNRPLEAPADLLTQKADAQAAWAQLLSAKDLPIVHNPEAGFVISANEAPDNARVSISLFFAEPTRAERIATLLQKKAPATLETLRIIQTDTHSAPAEKIATALSEVAGKLRPQSSVYAELSRWDGHYDAQSQGALAFELVVAGLVEGLEKATGVTSVSAAWRPFTRLTEVLRAAAPPVLAEHLAAALDAADAPFQKHKTWGGLHRLRLYHPLARLPWLMGRLPSIDLPIGGSNETVMKAMHPFTRKVHRTPFGANARFLADLAHVDETFAALLGGQDGWPGSRTMFDLVGPWRQGDMVRLPLSQSARREAFPNITTIHPHHLTPTS